MILLTTESVRHVEREWATQGYAAIRGVALPREHFLAPDKGADLLLKRLSGDGGCCVLVEVGVSYLGSDSGLAASFAGPVNQGWRVLCTVSPAAAEVVLARLETILGLSGMAPSISERATKVVAPIDPPRSQQAASPFGTDMVAEARAGRIGPALFRERETDALLRILTKEGKNAACLVGEAGVGKTKVVEHLAVRVAAGTVPASLRSVRILDVNLSFLMAGASAVNQTEGRLKEVLDDARADRNTILFFDELHVISSPLHQSAQLVKPDLGRGRIRCIGATTQREFRAIEDDAALARRFQVVPVMELTAQQSLEVLRDYARRLSTHHRVLIDGAMLQSALELSQRHIPQRRLPDKALDLLDESCALARIEAESAGAS